jgi:putative PIN family toxin of toxin-antitoxin system
MRIVADTNTVVSGLGWRGAPARIIDMVTAGKLTLITSPPLLDELARVLRYPKLAKIFPDPEGTVRLIDTIADTLHPIMQLAVVTDEPDNRVLEAAVTGQVDRIITGDSGLLALKSFENIPIITAGELVPLLGDRLQ